MAQQYYIDSLIVLGRLKCKFWGVTIISIIFVHIPKSAGSSIYSKLRDSLEGFPSGHIPLSQLLKVKRGCEGYFKFTFVRNPWDRVVSAFHYMQKGGMGAESKLDMKDYKKYFRDAKSFRSFILSDSFNTVYKDQQHFKPMLYYIDGLVDFIGRFENLQEDFGIICDKIGIPRQELPHKNGSKHKHYGEYYNEETKQIVAEKYAKDIEYFGYKFGE